MKLYVLRHGQTNYNKEGRFQGRNDIELNEEGIEETRKTAKNIDNIEFDKVFVSPLKRTIQTARIVTNNELEIDNRIIERSFGKLEGKKGIPDYEERVEEFGIETIEHLEERVRDFLKEIINKYNSDTNVLVVTHGGVAQIINKVLDKNYTKDNFKDFILENSKYICYEIERKRKMDIAEWQRL